MNLSLDPHAAGLSWTVTDEAMERSSHALATPEGVWLVDVVDDAEALERAVALGPVAGVVQLLDRHNRDCRAVAQRLGVPHLAVPHELPGTPFKVVRVVDVPRWHEIALWWPDRRTLVVAEAIGTNAFSAVGGAHAGIHVMLRLTPPKALKGFEPEHLLVGHGPAVHGPAAAEAVKTAYARSRRDIPRLIVSLPKLAKR